MKQWRPRPASEGLRSRIFASEQKIARDEAPEGLAWHGMMRWLVPALGCFLLATASFVGPDAPVATRKGSLEEQRMAVSLVSAATDFNKNSVPATTLEWTFGQRSSSSSDSFPGAETNLLSK